MNRHYIYALLNPFEKLEWEYEGIQYNFKPFYIGMGVDKRIDAHTQPSKLMNDLNISKRETIYSIIRRGEKIIKVKLKENISQLDAKRIEIELITLFGRSISKEGPLTNMSRGGDITSANIVGGENIHSKEVFQYDLEGNFISKYDCLRCIPEILGQDVSYNAIGDSCRGNTKYYPNKCFTAAGYMWFYEFKSNKIKSYADIMLQKYFQFSEDFTMEKVFRGIREVEKGNIFNRQGVYKAIKNKSMYKGFYWSMDKNINPMEFVQTLKSPPKPIFQFDLEGNLINKYTSINDIPKEYPKNYVYRACRLGCNYRYFYWSYNNKIDTNELFPTFYKGRKEVIQKDLNGNILNEFKSIREASLNICGSLKCIHGISDACKGKLKKSYGFKWEYKYK